MPRLPLFLMSFMKLVCRTDTNFFVHYKEPEDILNVTSGLSNGRLGSCLKAMSICFILNSRPVMSSS